MRVCSCVLTLCLCTGVQLQSCVTTAGEQDILLAIAQMQQSAIIVEAQGTSSPSLSILVYYFVVCWWTEALNLDLFVVMFFPIELRF